jgi:hypothetical protein
LLMAKHDPLVGCARSCDVLGASPDCAVRSVHPPPYELSAGGNNQRAVQELPARDTEVLVVSTGGGVERGGPRCAAPAPPVCRVGAGASHGAPGETLPLPVFPCGDFRVLLIIRVLIKLKGKVLTGSIPSRTKLLWN